MSDDFQVGDVVVCVDDSPCSAPGDATLPCPYRKGELARIVDIWLPSGHYAHWKAGLALSPRKHPTDFIICTRFRKLRTADEEFIAQIYACHPHHVGEPA